MKYILKTTVLAFVCCLFALNTANAQENTRTWSAEIKASPYTYLFLSGDDIAHSYNSEKTFVLSGIFNNQYKFSLGLGLMSRNYKYTLPKKKSYPDFTTSYLHVPVTFTYIKNINKTLNISVFVSTAVDVQIGCTDVINEAAGYVSYSTISGNFSDLKYYGNDFSVRIGSDITFKLTENLNFNVSPFYNYLIMKYYKGDEPIFHMGNELLLQYKNSYGKGVHSAGVMLGLEYLF